MLVLFRIREPVLIELQFLIRELLGAASSSPSQLSADPARQAAQETVLAALDRAFLDTSLLDLESARSFQKSLHIVKQIETRLSANLGTAIYSDGLASELRISARTMHSAMLKIRGMSLHRYLRLRAAMGPSGDSCSLAARHCRSKHAHFPMAFGIWASLRPCMPPNLAKHRQQLWLARSSGYHEKWPDRPYSSLGLGPKAWFAKQYCKDYAKFRSHSWRRV
jgi:hypothetical protein